MNCPNCGAPIISAVCEYCGTRHRVFEPTLREMEREKKLIEMGVKQLERSITIERLYEDAINAVRNYTGGD